MSEEKIPMSVRKIVVLVQEIHEHQVVLWMTKQMIERKDYSQFLAGGCPPEQVEVEAECFVEALKQEIEVLSAILVDQRNLEAMRAAEEARMKFACPATLN